MSTFGKARFFEEFTAPGKVRCWTSAWQRTQKQVAAEVPFSRWIGEEFEVTTNTSGDLLVAADGQFPRRVSSPWKFAPASATKVLIDELCDDEPSPKADNRTAAGMLLLQAGADEYETRVRNERALASLVEFALGLILQVSPMLYAYSPDSTLRFDHSAVKAQWDSIQAGSNPYWWVCESKVGDTWRVEVHPFFHDDKEYRIVKSERHPDVIRGKVKAEYAALYKAGEIEHWKVEYRTSDKGEWNHTSDPLWIEVFEYRLTKSDSHPDVVRDKVRAEWTAWKLAFASGKPVREAHLEYRNLEDKHDTWHQRLSPMWTKCCEYRIVYSTPKKLIDMSAMPAGTNTTVGKIVGHHLFQKPGSVFTLEEGANRIQEWKAEDVDLVEKQDWIPWEATATSECPLPNGVRAVIRHASSQEFEENTPATWLWNTRPTGSCRIVAFKIQGARDGYTFNAKEAA